MDQARTILEKDKDIRGWSGWETLGDDAVANLVSAEALHIPLAMMENNVLRGFATYLLAHSHPEFWTCASSSTGKYHPKQHNEKTEVMTGLVVGGLIAHTWHVLAMAFESMRRYGYNNKLSRKELAEWAYKRDCLAFACIFHDWAKNGDPTKGQWGEHTISNHGEVAAELISNIMVERFLVAFPEVRGEAEDDLRRMVGEACFAIQHHYGIWSNAKLKPTSDGLTELCLQLQEGDYFCTRRFLGEFDRKVVADTLRSMSPSELGGCQTIVVPIQTQQAESAEEPIKKVDIEDFIW